MPPSTATTVRKRKRLGIGEPQETLTIGTSMLNGEDFQHVRHSRARVSGNRIGRGSIGVTKRRVPAHRVQWMSETASNASISPSQEAEIAAALGRRSIVLVG